MSAFALAAAVAAVVIVAVSSDVVPCTGDCTTLQLQQGSVKGEMHDDNAHFLGIPYGKAPVGELRWQPPQLPDPWAGVKKTTEYAHSCMQDKDVYTDFGSASEDCLYLNMWLPKNVGKDGRKYPVMIFFHGGSFITGSAMFPIYSAEAVVKLQDEVIVIAANYRLGVFGYLGSEELRAIDNSTGNFGLQDQRAVMQWVQTNADSFWGNSSSVTIYGESAGAGSVSDHLVAVRSAGHFHKAIMESGPLTSWVSKPMYIAEKDFGFLVNATNCTAATNKADCLRQVNSSNVLALSHREDCNGMLDWAPVVDGVEFKKNPRELASEGGAVDVPVILGSNRDEGTLFVDDPNNINSSTYDLYLQKLFGVGLGQLVKKQYPPSRFPATKDAGAEWWTASHVLGDSAISCPARQTAHWLVKSPGRKSPVFMYFFNHELDLLKTYEVVQKKHAYGCCHASELALVFDVSELLIGAEKHMAEDVVRWWQSFATHGNPGSNWPAFTADGYETLIWEANDDRTNYTVTTTLKTADCNFWAAQDIPYLFPFGDCALNSTNL